MDEKAKAYWLKRQEQWWKNQDKADDKLQKRLEKYYLKASKEVEREIAYYFAQYGKNNVIEFRELLKELSQDQRTMLYERMDDFAREYPEYQRFLPVRESIYKLNRLQGLHYSMQIELVKLGAIEQKEFEAHLLATYGKNYSALLSELGIGTSFATISDTTIQNTIYTKWVQNDNFSGRIWVNKEKMLNYMKNEFRDGLARGDSFKEISNAMRNRFGVGAFDAKRLVYTESAFVLNQSHKNGYLTAGVERYEFSAVLDRRTSPVCKNMDGKEFAFDEAEVGSNFPPLHTFCRSTFIGILDDLE